LLSERDSLHKAALEKVTVENIQKAEELNKKLEDRNKHQEELNKKIAVLEN
jgi:hypothetical protein